jgi:hypothetical protein
MTPTNASPMTLQPKRVRFERTVSYLDRIPTEISLGILGNVLICVDPLAFTALPLSLKEYAQESKKRGGIRHGRHSSTILRLCRLNHCEKDEPEAAFLMSNFSSLCRVSKRMRSLSRDIFFAKNKWVLHGAEMSNFDAIAWVLKYWGQEALLAMTNVRLDLQSIGSFNDLRAYEAVKAFVEVVKHSQNLQVLEVKWVASYRHLQTRYTEHRRHQLSVERDIEIERNSDGGRGPLHIVDKRKQSDSDEDEDDDEVKWLGPESEGEDWAEREVVLEPLQELRGLGKVRIEGTVTEAWASYLEDVMVERKGSTVAEFKRQPSTIAT